MHYSSANKSDMIDKELNYGRHIIEKFLRNCDNPGLIVDLGAGHGIDLETAKKIFPNAGIHAVEVYKPYCAELDSLGFTVHSVDIEKDVYPFNNNSVDVVIANQIIEHLKEIFWVFHQTSRILKQGGSFIIGVPNIAALHNRLLLSFGRQPTQLKNWSAHVRGWTKKDILSFVNNIFPGGYTLKEFGGSNFYPFPPAVSKPLANLFPNLAWGIFIRFEKTKEYNNEFIKYPVEKQLETNFYLG